ncbi:serine/threonine-protein kinase fray2 [Coffea eugenioides]|uniref:RRM domain-containing protein n=1 Tax=Coffea arabica TaxID=13443 RepID=A0A6P6T4Y1_COFAR|nr:serine/threonine-protein kinase fray2-like [Coffea arabica]XP_027175466.1 serine/threonine-protein kinase fray2 [Coffea eugenioides]
MTIDDDSSIYVGGLPYDSTEDSLRQVFDPYGSVVAVKIINDRTVGGKCYGFVTFTNPRSAMRAIDEMDGGTIEGRTVRVNEVRSRGGRSNFGRESFRRNSERDFDADRGRSREKDYDHDRDRYRDNHRERSLEFDEERERGYDHLRERDRSRDRIADRDRVRDQNKGLDIVARERERIHDYNWERGRVLDKETQRTNNHHKSSERDKDQMPKFLDRSYTDEHGKREHLSQSSGDHIEVTKQLEVSNQQFQELQKEVSEMEELAKEKNVLVLKLQEKSQKLEDSLTAAKRLTSYRQMQLAKLNKFYLQVRDCNERLKHSEHELQALVSSTMSEMEYGDVMGARDGILTNGSAQA